ncbi:MAG TPA: hypothetical protein VGQ28_08420 [Thermoanaerobaculia bacterium]|jgi:hypothetical protein|nr:hypothetical protein [Thermoanaerobaculia bacterium]
MTRLRIALLVGSSLVTMVGGFLLAPTDAHAFICSNTVCSSPSTCTYGAGNQCSLGHTSPEEYSCVSGSCS